MEWYYWLLIVIFLLLVILYNYPSILFLLYQIIGKNKNTNPVELNSNKKDGTIIYTADNFPIGGSGIFAKDKIFIKNQYYVNHDGTKTNLICWTVTMVQFMNGYRGMINILQHENGHSDQLDRYNNKYGKFFGWLFWCFWMVGNYSEVWIKHDNKSLEIEPEKDETV